MKLRKLDYQSQRILNLLIQLDLIKMEGLKQKLEDGTPLKLRNFSTKTYEALCNTLGVKVWVNPITKGERNKKLQRRIKFHERQIISLKAQLEK